MAATTTVAIGVGGLAAGAAVLGAIGLGAAALGLLRSGSRRGGGRRRGGRRGGHRGRRQAQDQEETDRLERFLQVIRYEDVTGCALRLACELAGMEEDQMAIEELAIVNLLSPVTAPGQGLLPNSASADYKAALTAGSKGKNCAKEYPICPYNSTVLMNTVMNYLP
ncbi:unnamed protein product [Meganyctiphanes norvegica]|uniref:Uncharacterized protein n=1 Tax=Meganyctiphanes norvegica TaxID=48144 RepID=A0AAV2QX31_MEGNR